MVLGRATVEIIGVELWKTWLFTHLGGVVTGVAFLVAERRTDGDDGVGARRRESNGKT